MEVLQEEDFNFSLINPNPEKKKEQIKEETKGMSID
jgi:hypothetical protein